MKLIITFFSIIFFSSLCMAQGSPKEVSQFFQSPETMSLRYESDVLDSVIDWAWNVDNATWDFSNKHLFFYDDQHNLTEYRIQFWTGSEWKYSSRKLSSYDSHQNLISVLSQGWNGFGWTDTNLRSYGYDSRNNEISDLAQTWHDTVWINNYLNTAEYNNNDERIGTLAQRWDDTIWTNITRSTFLYNSEGLESITSMDYYDGQGWVNSDRTLYTRQDGLLLESLSQDWDEVEWVDRTKYQYTRDGNGNLTLLLIQRLISNVWTNYYQYIFEHTAFNEVNFEHGDRWVSNAWENEYEYQAHYDNRENLASEFYRYWEDAWVDSDSSKYFYTFASSVDKATMQDQGFSISPNPTSDQIFVNLEAGQEGAVAYRMYTMDGRIMETARLDNPASKSINVSQYLPGSYILQVKIGDQWKMKVFVKK